MASLWDGFLGQQQIPDISVPSGRQVLGQIGKMIPKSVQNTIDYNTGLAGPLTDIQLGVEKQYDPNAAALRAATSAKVLQMLKMGGQLTPDVMQAIGQASAERNAGGGFTGSSAGRAYTARDFGMTAMDIENQRLNNAEGYVRSGPSLNQLWTPRGFVDPTDLGNLYTSSVGAENEKRGMTSQMQFENSMNLINRPMQLANSWMGMAGTGAAAAKGAGIGASYGGNGATPETAGVVGTAGASSM